LIRAGSVRLRLLAGGAILVVLALAATGLALSAFFRRHVVAQFDKELVNQLNSPTAALQRHEDGTLSIHAEPGIRVSMHRTEVATGRSRRSGRRCSGRARSGTGTCTWPRTRRHPVSCIGTRSRFQALANCG
jgi:hypothetical protein